MCIRDRFGNVPDVAAAQAGGLFGGATTLTPESSDTFTIGAVFTPSFIQGLTASIDYFDLSIDDAIAQGFGAQNLLDTCLATGDPEFCGFINRDGAGSLNSGTSTVDAVGFTLININAAELSTSGVDLQVNYSFDIDNWGDFGLQYASCLLYTSPSPRDATLSRMPSSA